jgi:hypothetical protein
VNHRPADIHHLLSQTSGWLRIALPNCPSQVSAGDTPHLLRNVSELAVQCDCHLVDTRPERALPQAPPTRCVRVMLACTAQASYREERAGLQVIYMPVHCTYCRVWWALSHGAGVEFAIQRNQRCVESCGGQSERLHPIAQLLGLPVQPRVQQLHLLLDVLHRVSQVWPQLSTRT